MLERLRGDAMALPSNSTLVVSSFSVCLLFLLDRFDDDDDEEDVGAKRPARPLLAFASPFVAVVGTDDLLAPNIFFSLDGFFILVVCCCCCCC